MCLRTLYDILIAFVFSIVLTIFLMLSEQDVRITSVSINSVSFHFTLALACWVLCMCQMLQKQRWKIATKCFVVDISGAFVPHGLNQLSILNMFNGCIWYMRDGMRVCVLPSLHIKITQSEIIMYDRYAYNLIYRKKYNHPQKPYGWITRGILIFFKLRFCYWGVI